MREHHQVNQYRGILGRLARDKTGSALAMMAAAMIPTIILAGSAIDVTRMYVTKTRLQQACDAGVLAGRKFLIDSNATTLDSNAQTQAQKFFGNNFKAGWLGTSAVSFTPTKTADKQVAGTASATLPMTIMASFASPQKVITAQCEARFDVADADIMFVLDTTGSMSCTPADSATCNTTGTTYKRADGSIGTYSPEKSGSKMQASRDAVLAFYDTMVANADPTTHIRYGFVPYNAQVNVGYLLPAGSMVSSWHYQSRRAINENYVSGADTVVTQTGVDNATCLAMNNTRSHPIATNDYKFGADNLAYRYTSNSWTAAASGTCKLNRKTYTPKWRYKQWDQDVSKYITGAATQDPTVFASSLSKWRGCVEERDTTASTSFNGTLPADLDPDTPPTDTSTRWRPVWPDAMWYRNQNGPTSDTTPYSDTNVVDGLTGTTFGRFPNDKVTCMKEASRIATMTRGEVSAFVNHEDFKPSGSTYLDIGMIWGLRLLSPTGLFASDTAAWPGRNVPNRHIIFMTDGFMQPTTQVYSTYGVEQLDRRVTGNTLANQTDNHNARFKAVCAAARAKNITVWMIAFGAGSKLSQEMTDCASPGKAYYVPNAAALTDKFKEIATQIAQLRLSK